MSAVDGGVVPVRPTTSRGRRYHSPDGSATRSIEQVSASEREYAVGGELSLGNVTFHSSGDAVKDAATERPKTGRGRRGSSPLFKNRETEREATLPDKLNVDILTLNSDGEEHISPRNRGTQWNRKNMKASGDNVRRFDADVLTLRGEDTPTFHPVPPVSFRPSSSWDHTVQRRRSSATIAVRGTPEIENLPEVTKRPGSSRYKVIPDIGPIGDQQTPVVQSSSSRNMKESPRQTVASKESATKSNHRHNQTNVKGIPTSSLEDQVKRGLVKEKVDPAKSNEVKVKVDQIKGNQDHAQTPVIKRPPNFLPTTSGNTKPMDKSMSFKAVLPSAPSRSSTTGRSPVSNTRPRTFKPLMRRPKLPREPGLDESDRVALAIKLPSGQRVQRFFRLTDTISNVMKFAEIMARLDFTGCELVCTDPRLVLADMSLTIEKSQLPTKTLLYVQHPD